jgi:hypothetical protein
MEQIESLDKQAVKWLNAEFGVQSLLIAFVDAGAWYWAEE